MFVFTGNQYVSIRSYAYRNLIYMDKFLRLQQLNMYRYVLIFKGIQHASVGSYVYRNSICIDTFSCLQEFNMYRYVIIFQYVSTIRSYV
jgi:hypothetical protein